MKKGYVQVYTGNGKGKTTASIGQALRAAGAGLKVYIGQYVKTMKYSEVKLIEERIPEIEVEQLGFDGCIINRAPNADEIKAARDGLAHAKEKMVSGLYDMIVLDEITIAHHFKMIDTEELLNFISAKPEGVELIITGRYAPAEVIEKADLVTNMDEVKHYYEVGVEARDGIER